MIEIRKIQTIDGRRIDHFVPSHANQVIEAQDLILFPALIDPHVHFRTPGAEHKENWESGILAAIAGGVTTVFDMPNNIPSCITAERLREKKRLINEQIGRLNIPFRYHLFFGADAKHPTEMSKIKNEIIGLKVYMGSTTGDLLMAERSSLEEAFQIAAQNDLLVAVHAEDEQIIELNKKKHAGKTDPIIHSVIREPSAAAASVALAIELAKKHKVRLYIVHVSCREELDLIRKAKKENVPVYAEAAPHHLFLHEEAYRTLGTKGLVNPPLRTSKDCESLWEAIHDYTIDTIGTDHAPHTLEEKNRSYGFAPSGFPSIELYLPLLLNAYHEQKLSLERIVSLTHTRPQEIFNLPLNEDVVLVDLKRKKTVEDHKLKTKAKWSPYSGWTLHGWPRYTILGGQLFDLETF